MAALESIRCTTIREHILSGGSGDDLISAAVPASISVVAVT